MEGGRKGEREGGREGGREGEWERWREGGRDGTHQCSITAANLMQLPHSDLNRWPLGGARYNSRGCGHHTPFNTLV